LSFTSVSSEIEIQKVFKMSGKIVIDSALRAAANLRSSNLPKDVSKVAAAMLSSAPSGGKHELPDLSYDYAAIERKYNCTSILEMKSHLFLK
jgi:hypothetical protein